MIPNRDEIIRMAREAGFHAWYTQPEEHPDHVAIIERLFAAAYAAGAAAEREVCQKACDELAGLLFCHGDKSGAEIAISLRDDIRARGQA